MKHFLYNLYSVIAYYFLKIISPIVTFRFLMVETRSIGHMNIPIEIHLQKKKYEVKKNNIIDIYFCEKKIANVYLWKKWREILDIKINDRLSNYFFEPIFRYIIKKRDKKFLVPFKHNPDTWNYHLSIKGETPKDNSLNYKWEMYDSPFLLEETVPIIKLTDAEKIFGEKILKKNNILKSDKIILLIVRDSAYDSYWRRRFDPNVANERNNDIDEFRGLVKYLCENHYKVIRMGKIMHKKLNYKHDNFIDYAFSDFKSDFLDVFLFSVSKFIISTGTGLESISNLFRKKLLYLNFADIGALHYPLNSNLTFVYPKKFIDKKKNKELSIYDFFKYGLDNVESYKSDIMDNIKVKSITTEQMINAIKEMLSYLDGKYPDSSLEANREINNLLQESYGFENNFYWSRDFLDKKINRS